ncbi:MAG: glycosyltransferase [Candidatus Thorarchaeota archaeon]
MHKLANDASLREEMGRRCRKKILRDYSWESQIELIEDVYKKVVNNT